MVGLLGCGCCSSSTSYCALSSTGTFTDNFNPPFLIENLPPSDPWPTGSPSHSQTFEGWVKWQSKTQTETPWRRVQTTGKFLPFILRSPNPWNFPEVAKTYWTPELNANQSRDQCVYSANYRLAKYTTEVTVSLPISKAPAVQQGAAFNVIEQPRTGPNFVVSGAWSNEKEVSGGRLFGPRLCVGLRRQLGGGLPWQHYWLVLDKYTTTQDVFYGAYIGNTDNPLTPKDTYRIGVEIECTNLEDYGTGTGPVFVGRALIDGQVVYTNTYGPFLDNGANLVGGRNNWRPAGHCRCMYAGDVFGRDNLHPITAYSFGTNSPNGYVTDSTESFWADDFTFTETFL